MRRFGVLICMMGTIIKLHRDVAMMRNEQRQSSQHSTQHTVYVIYNLHSYVISLFSIVAIFNPSSLFLITREYSTASYIMFYFSILLC